MKRKDIRQFIILLCGIVLVAVISTQYFFRIDLTAEKRHTLTPETRKVLNRLDAPLYVNIFLDGDLPIPFRRFRNNIREMLDDFRVHSGSRIVVRFFDPTDAANAAEREDRFVSLEENGLRRISIHKTNRDGSLSQQIIFPGAIILYKDRQASVNLLNNNSMLPPEAAINASLETLEYELIKTINLLSTDSIGTIALTTGRGELRRAEIYDLGRELSNFYNVEFQTIDGQLDALDRFEAVIIAKPQEPFDEKDKFIIDRYIMRGGKVMWLIDGARVYTDSLVSMGMTFALANELNLEDQLFTYGVRVNYGVVQDVMSNFITVIPDGSSQFVPAPWLYYPLVVPSPNHAITRNLAPVWHRYVSEIDTVGRDGNIRKTVLLQTSEWSRVRNVPVMIRLSEVQQPVHPQHFNRSHCITAVLLEGSFPSVFRHRNVRHLFPELQERQAERSVETKMIVVADGDIARNDVRNTPQGPIPSNPLGFDRNTNQTFANREFLINAINYLTDDAGLMNLRNREFTLRLLNRQKVTNDLLKWQVINIVLPMILLIVGGIIYNRQRRYRYGRQ